MAEPSRVGPRVAVYGDDMQMIGNALHAVIAAELVNLNREDAVDCAASLIRNIAGGEVVAPGDAIKCARRLKSVLDSWFKPRQILVEHPR